MIGLYRGDLGLGLHWNGMEIMQRNALYFAVRRLFYGVLCESMKELGVWFINVVDFLLTEILPIALICLFCCTKAPFVTRKELRKEIRKENKEEK